MALFQAVKTDTGRFWTTEVLNTIAVTFRSTGCQGKFITFPPWASLHEVSSLGYFLTFLIIFSFTFSNHNFMQLHFGLWILQTLLNYRDIIYSLTQIIYCSVITEIEHLYSTYDTPPADLRTLLVLVYVILPAPPGSMYHCLSHFTDVVTTHREASKPPSVTQWEVVK